MPPKSKRRKHSGGAVDLTPPAVESFGFRCGASSASEEGFLCRKQASEQQSAINQHGGDKSDCHITIAQAPTHGMEPTGPNSANNSNTAITKSLLNSNAESEYDDQVGGKKYKRKKTYRRKTKKRRRKTKRRKNKHKTKKKRGKSKK